MGTGLLSTSDVAQKAGVSTRKARYILTSRAVPPVFIGGNGRAVYGPTAVRTVKAACRQIEKRRGGQ
jgi:hypothetical protein